MSYRELKGRCIAQGRAEAECLTTKDRLIDILNEQSPALTSLPPELLINELWSNLSLREIARFCQTDRNNQEFCEEWFPPNSRRATSFWFNRLSRLPYEERINEFKQISADPSFYPLIIDIASSPVLIMDSSRFADAYLSLIKREMNDEAHRLNDLLLNNPIYQLPAPHFADITLGEVRRLVKMILVNQIGPGEILVLEKTRKLLRDDPRLDFVAYAIYDLVSESHNPIDVYIRLDGKFAPSLSWSAELGIYSLTRLLKRAICLHEQSLLLLEQLERRKNYYYNVETICYGTSPDLWPDPTSLSPRVFALFIIQDYDSQTSLPFDQHIAEYIAWVRSGGYEVYAKELERWIAHYRANPSTETIEISEDMKEHIRTLVSVTW